MSDQSRPRPQAGRARAALRAAAAPVRAGASAAGRRTLSAMDAGASRVGLAPRPTTPLPGWRVVARKELGDNIGSIRFVILLALIGLACVGAVFTASDFLRDAAEGATERPSLFLLLFTQSPEIIPSFVTLVALFGPLIGLAFGFDAINQERADGTLPRLVSQPMHRDEVISGKFVAGLATIGLALVTLVAITAGIGILRLGITPSGSDVARLLAYLAVTLAYIGVWLAFAILCSVFLRRAATAVMTALSAWLVFTMFGSLLTGVLVDFVGPSDDIGQARWEHNISLVTPSGLYESSSTALLDPTIRTLAAILRPEQVDRAVPGILSLDQSLLVAWPQVTALVAACVVMFTLGYLAFLRQEIRA